MRAAASVLHYRVRVRALDSERKSAVCVCDSCGADDEDRRATPPGPDVSAQRGPDAALTGAVPRAVSWPPPLRPRGPPPGPAPTCPDLESAPRRRRGAETGGDDDVAGADSGRWWPRGRRRPLPRGPHQNFTKGWAGADRSARGLGSRFGTRGVAPRTAASPRSSFTGPVFLLSSFVWWPRAQYRTFLLSRTCLIFTQLSSVR